jgi:hypothetical protein
MRIRIKDASGLAIVCDGTIIAPVAGESRERPIEQLEASAREGRLFFIDGEDPIDLTLEVVSGEPLATELAARFTPVGGGFLLDIPSGSAAVAGYDAWARGNPPEASVSVAPGSHLVVAYARRLPDARQYEADIERLVDPRAVAFHRRVTRLAPLGCLPLIVLAIALLLQRWTLASYAAGVALLASAAYAGVSRSGRFRAVEDAQRAYKRDLPAYVLELRPVERSPSLVGGWLTT